MTESPLDAALSGILGGRTATAFEKAFGLRTVGDLLAHYPRRYARRGELTALDQLPIGDAVTIVAEVIEVRERPMRARRGSILEVKITDGEGILTLTFFNQAWRAKDLSPGVRGIFAGKVGAYRGALQLAHPDYELFDEASRPADSQAAKKWAQMPIPIYPATSTIASWQVQKSVELVLDQLPGLDDPVPAEVRAEEQLLGLGEAYELMHRPQKDADFMRARDTLRYHEAFILQAALLQQRQSDRARIATVRVPKDGGLLDRFDDALPFSPRPHESPGAG
jgi:ATP-dependent DNA helicase RecG